jgi:hypothetical protein
MQARFVNRGPSRCGAIVGHTAPLDQKRRGQTRPTKEAEWARLREVLHQGNIRSEPDMAK